jgi:hypothetical protein
LPPSPSNLELLEIHDSGLAAKPDALGPSPGLAGPHALADPLPLLLGHPSEHGEQEIPEGAPGIHPGFLVTHHPHAGQTELLEVADHRQDPFAAESVQGPDQDHVEFPAVGASENLSKRSAVASSAARSLGTHADDVEAETFRPAAKLALLVLHALVSR